MTQETFNRSFDSVGEAYLKHRPAYPPKILEALFEFIPNYSTVIELGAGPGNLTEAMLRGTYGTHITAVEPGPTFQEMMTSRLEQYARARRLKLVTDTALGAARKGLLMGGRDAVVIGTARKWLGDNEEVGQMIHDRLRPGGHVATLHNTNQVSDNGGEADRFHQAVAPILERVGMHRPFPPADKFEYQSFGPNFSLAQFRIEEVTKVFAPDTYLELLDTYNPFIKDREANPGRHDQMRQALRQVAKDFGCATLHFGVTLEVEQRTD